VIEGDRRANEKAMAVPALLAVMFAGKVNEFIDWDKPPDWNKQNL
jgi:hypothetical protein